VDAVVTLNQVGAAAFTVTAGLLAVTGVSWWLLRDIDRAVTCPAPVRACRCGHDRRYHAHYRRGSDCSACSCARWRRRSLR
jgi:hypothetical protein